MMEGSRFAMLIPLSRIGLSAELDRGYSPKRAAAFQIYYSDAIFLGI